MVSQDWTGWRDRVRIGAMWLTTRVDGDEVLLRWSRFRSISHLGLPPTGSGRLEAIASRANANSLGQPRRLSAEAQDDAQRRRT